MNKSKSLLSKFVLVLSLFAGTSSFAQVQDVKVSGNLRGLNDAELIIYESTSKDEAGRTVIKNGDFELTIKADPSEGRKYFVYLPILDDGQRAGVDSRIFFVDNSKVKLSGKLRAGRIAKFKMENSVMYDNYINSYKKLDNTKVRELEGELGKLEELSMYCANGIEREKYSRQKHNVQGRLDEAIYQRDISLINQLEKGVENKGLDARICDVLYGLKYSFLKPAIDRYTEYFGLEHMKKNYWTNRLLERYYIVSMFLPGRPAFECEFKKVNGEYVKLSELKGKYVYIHLWDYDHDQSSDQLESLKKLSEKFKKKNIVFLNISVNDDIQRWAEMAKRIDAANILQVNVDLQYEKSKNLPWDRTFKYVYKTKGLPRAILITPEQTIEKFRMHTPNSESSFKYLKKLL